MSEPMLPRLATDKISGFEPMLPTAIPLAALPWLDPERARAEPWEALRLAGAWLPAPLLEELARRQPWAALWWVPDRLPEPLLETLARREPKLALKYAGHRLSSALRAELTELAEQGRPAQRAEDADDV